MTEYLTISERSNEFEQDATNRWRWHADLMDETVNDLRSVLEDVLTDGVQDGCTGTDRDGVTPCECSTARARRLLARTDFEAEAYR